MINLGVELAFTGETIRVLTDHGDPHLFSACRVRIDPSGGWLGGMSPSVPGLRPLRNVLRGCVMFWRSIRHRGSAVVVTYGSTAAFVFAACQYLARPFVTPRIHVMFDLLLDRRRSGVAGRLDVAKAAVFNTVVAGAVVWGKSDLDLFNREFGLDRERLHFHPYHITLDDFGDATWEEADGDFVFCGGNEGRDFRTVIDAAGELGIPLRVATFSAEAREAAARWPGVDVGGVTPHEFRGLLAGCRFLVEAHPRSFFRTAGHQTMLNAMYFGKPVLLADRRSAECYVRHGVDGVVIGAEDGAAMKEWMQRLWEDGAWRSELSERARRKAHRPIYGTLRHIQSVYNLAIRLHVARRGGSYREAHIAEY